MIILPLLLTLIFTSLGLIHFYWLFGGKWGVSKVIPTKDDGGNTFSPPQLATFIVGFGLLLMGLLYLLKSGLIEVQLPDFVLNYGLWIIPSIFILRAIGEFHYVGFFKKIKHTEFAKADSLLFSPLCMIIGIIGMIIQLV
jgi:hypothetical protein